MSRRTKVTLTVSVGVFHGLASTSSSSTSPSRYPARFLGTSLGTLSWVLTPTRSCSPALLVPAGRWA